MLSQFFKSGGLRLCRRSSSSPLPRASFDPRACESGRYEKWAAAGAFRPREADGRAGHGDSDATFSMLLPPPNVTGVLHVGHALTVSLQDALARWRRARGQRVLWLPGLDHAGIATQSVVERWLMQQEGQTRHDLGRERFVEAVWDWRDSQGDRIVSQLKGMGAGLDWDSEYFTLDKPRSSAVVEAFVRLHEAGLIYRRRRHVNWCCALRTAISDIEVDHVPLTPGKHATKGKRRKKKKQTAADKYTLLGPIPGHDPSKKYKFGAMVRFAYAVDKDDDDDADEELVVATTRLETMMGDVAVAVHPDDARYTHLHGRYLLHPFRAEEDPLRRIPVVTDAELVDMSTGTGAVKITPAHDPADFACAQRVMARAKAESPEGVGRLLVFPLNLRVFDEDGRVTGVCEGAVPRGTPRYDAREMLEELLSESGLLREEEEGDEGEEVGQEADDSDVVVLPTCSRSGDVVEPLLLPQWYVDTSVLSKDAARMGDRIIRGDRHAREWQRWLGQDQSQDWCVSRQLWWGHRIPAWRITGLVVRGEEANDLLERYNVHGTEGRAPSAETIQDNVDEDDAQWIVARNEAEAAVEARRRVLACVPERYALGGVDGDFEVALEQDEDVLDTWFSSGILPLSALGWPAAPEDGGDDDDDDDGDEGTARSDRLNDFYPLSVMETGSDILFFWVARMAMLCSFLEGTSGPLGRASTTLSASHPNESAVSSARPPFEQVLLHPMVRDKRGRKMSKSLGNVIDPLDVVRGVGLETMLEKLQDNANMGDAEKKRSAKDLRKEYPEGIPECGVDGLRFALCSYLEGPNMPGTINMDIQRAVSARHMCNKLWNASRFVLSHVQESAQRDVGRAAAAAAAAAAAEEDMTVNPDEVKLREQEGSLASAWILSRLDQTVREVDRSMEAFELASTTTALRKFLVNDFCDVYLEVVKAPLMGAEVESNECGGEVGRAENRAFLCKVLWTCLSAYLKLLHPIMPFVTEEIHESATKALFRAPSRQSPGEDLDDNENDHPLVHQGFPEHGRYVCENAEADFECGVLQPARAVRSLRKLAADTFGKEAMEGSRVEILAHEDDGAGALVSEHLSSVQQLSRCRDVSVLSGLVDSDGVGNGREADFGSQTCLSRQLLFPRGRGGLTIRVVLPPTVLVASAAENARSEIRRLKTRLGKSSAQLEKLEALTSRPTYLEMSPPDVQAKHVQKIGELGADIEDMRTTVEILERVASGQQPQRR